MAHTMYAAVKSTTATATTTANWVKKAMHGRDGRGHLHTHTDTHTCWQVSAKCDRNDVSLRARQGLS